MYGSMKHTDPFMEHCDGPLGATPPYLVFENSNVTQKLETDKTGTVNYTSRVENTLERRIWKRQSIVSVIV